MTTTLGLATLQPRRKDRRLADNCFLLRDVRPDRIAFYIRPGGSAHTGSQGNTAHFGAHCEQVERTEHSARIVPVWWRTPFKS
jgi:hypothetical protein